jgi:hypothetical protein
MLDEPGGSVFWPAQQLYDAANETILDLFANTKIAVVEADFLVNSNTDLYAIPPTIMIPQFVVFQSATFTITTNTIGGVGGGFGMGAFGSEPFGGGGGTITTSTTSSWLFNEKYWISDQGKLEQYSRTWRQFAPERPKFFVMFGLTQIRVWPIPDQSYIFQIWGVPWPSEISAVAEDIAVDQQLKLVIAYRTAGSLLEATRPDMADVFYKESDENLNLYKIRLRNRQGHNIHRLRPGTHGPSMSSRIVGADTGVISIGRRLP